MAHRELLLLLLAVVIVAIATAAGIVAFSEASAKNRQDTLIARGVELATNAQEWYGTPAMYGGGGGNFDGIDIWRITQREGSAEWMEEENGTRYRAEQIPDTQRVRIIGEDLEMGFRVAIVFDQSSILNTTYGTGGIIYVEGDPA